MRRTKTWLLCAVLCAGQLEATILQGPRHLATSPRTLLLQGPQPHQRRLRLPRQSRDHQPGLGPVIRQERQTNFRPPSPSFALAPGNQAPALSAQFLANPPSRDNFAPRPRQGRPLFSQGQFRQNTFRQQQRQQGFRPQQGFRNNNNNLNPGFQPQQQQQQQGFQPQQQQQGFQPQQQQQGFQAPPQQLPQSPQISLLGPTFSSPAQSFQQSSTPSLAHTTTPAPTVTTTTAATTTEARVTTSPAPATRQPRVLPPETRPPRVLPPQLAPASRQPRVLAEREREGRAGHSSGYSAPASPAYQPPPAHGKKPAGKYAKILKLTGLDTAPVPEFDFMFSTENKINVMAAGELRNVCSQDVTVMRGSYDYWGPDGVQYTVDWYADETGFHPSAAHLPKPVAPNHPEVAAAVAAQLEAAAHHHYRQLRRKRDTSPGYAPPPPCPPEPSYQPAYEPPPPSYSL